MHLRTSSLLDAGVTKVYRACLLVYLQMSTESWFVVKRGGSKWRRYWGTLGSLGEY